MTTAAFGRASDALAAALVVATVVVGLVAYDAVPAAMVVHYTPPGGVYYGPETLPKAIGLSVVPAVAIVTVAALRGLPAVVDSEALTPVPTVYRLAVVGLAALLAAVQVALVLLNVL
jgi:hypothetical protein